GRGRKAVAEATFQSLFGLDPAAMDEQLPPMVELPSYEVAIAQALAKHPAILAAQESLLEANSRERVQRGAYSPTANLVLTSSQGENQGGVDGENNSKSAMLEVTFNLFSGYRDTHVRREASFLVKQAEETLAKSRKDVTERLSTAYRQWQTSAALTTTHIAQVAEATAVRAAYMEQYQLGRRTLLDLLDGESELFAAQNSLIDEQFQSLIEAYRVHFGMGNLLVALQIALPDAALPETVTFARSKEDVLGGSPPPVRQKEEKESPTTAILSDMMEAMSKEDVLGDSPPPVRQKEEKESPTTAILSDMMEAM
ncbi:MAG: TolC family protein, partial [Magnetococcus sp. XQGC-1]